MSQRDRRELNARIEAHRPKALPPDLGEKIDEAIRDQLRATAPRARPRERDLKLSDIVDPKPEVRPLTVEYVALRYQETLLRRDGRRALEPGVARECVDNAREMLREANQ